MLPILARLLTVFHWLTFAVAFALLFAPQFNVTAFIGLSGWFLLVGLHADFKEKFGDILSYAPITGAVSLVWADLYVAAITFHIAARGLEIPGWFASTASLTNLYTTLVVIGGALSIPLLLFAFRSLFYWVATGRAR